MLIIKRAQPFTLLETLIAMALTVAILTTMTFFYRQIMDLNTQAEIQQKESFKLRYVEGRFSKIFPQASAKGNKKNKFFFFTVSDPGGIFAQGSPTSLIFTFDNGVDLSKSFSNRVIARIFLDTKGRLCMAAWPSVTRWPLTGNLPMKFEILLEEVDSLKFWFFIAPDKSWQLEKEQTKNPANASNPKDQLNPAKGNQKTANVVTNVVVKPSPEGSWVNDWSQDYQQLPALIKLEIVRKKKTEFFTFPLSKCKRQPTYNQ
jgi:hypothetical protein